MKHSKQLFLQCCKIWLTTVLVVLSNLNSVVSFIPDLSMLSARVPVARYSNGGGEFHTMDSVNMGLSTKLKMH
jgi:hypothetical protein